MIKVARLGRPQGLEGFLGLYVDPSDHFYFEVGKTVHIDDRVLTVKTLRRGARGPEISFAEVTSRDQAEEIRNRDVYVGERRPLVDDEFWPEDLKGLEVRPGGGTVVDVVFGPSQDRLVVERDGSTFEVPFVAQLVPEVDVVNGFVELREIEGLS